METIGPQKKTESKNEEKLIEYELTFSKKNC